MKVRIEHLTKVFPGRKKGDAGVAAVNDMSFEIPDGKLIGLLGPSGCGKSTTLYMIAGLHKPTGGRIFFGDDEVTHLPPENRGIGLVFQNYALYPHFTVGKNIRFPLDNIRPALTKEDKQVIVEEMARLVDIEPYLERKPKELSGGQQQRVAIARALAKSPRVLLLDEPLSNLDARLRLQTREEIKRIQRETNITTIFVTHDQEEAMSISDLIVVMKDGVIQQIDEPQVVYDNPANLFVAKFLGSPAINVLEGEIKDGKLYIQDRLISSDKAFTKPLISTVINEQEVTRDQICVTILDKDGQPLENEKKSLKQTNNLFDLLKLQEADAIKPLAYVSRVKDNHMSVAREDHKSLSSDEEYKTALTHLYSILESEQLVNAAANSGILYRVQYVTISELETVETVETLADRKVVIGVRPEAFDILGKPMVDVDIEYVEHIGRDISLVGNFIDSTEGGETPHRSKIIIPSELRDKVKGAKVSLGIKRFHVFDYNGERLY